MTGDRAPLYWLRQRAGEISTVRLSAAEAAMVARRPGAVGDHMRPAGLVWRERDEDMHGGWAYFTITPIYSSEPS